MNLDFDVSHFTVGALATLVSIFVFGAILKAKLIDQRDNIEQKHKQEMVKLGFGYYTNNIDGNPRFVYSKPCQ